MLQVARRGYAACRHALPKCRNVAACGLGLAGASYASNAWATSVTIDDLGLDFSAIVAAFGDRIGTVMSPLILLGAAVIAAMFCYRKFRTVV